MNRKQFIALFTLPFFTKIPKVCEGSPVEVSQKSDGIVKCNQGLIPQINKNDGNHYYCDKVTREDFDRVATELNKTYGDTHYPQFSTVKWMKAMNGRLKIRSLDGRIETGNLIWSDTQG